MDFGPMWHLIVVCNGLQCVQFIVVLCIQWYGQFRATALAYLLVARFFRRRGEVGFSRVVVLENPLLAGTFPRGRFLTRLRLSAFTS